MGWGGGVIGKELALGEVDQKSGILSYYKSGQVGICTDYTQSFLHPGLLNDPTHILDALQLGNLFPSIFSFDPTTTL